MKAMDVVADFKPIIENVLEFKYRYLVYLTGRAGLGKSSNIAKSLLIAGLLKPMRILCCREHMTSIKDSVHSQLADIIREYQLPYVIYNDTIRSANGTVFIFRGLRETGVQDIKSLANANIAWIEEGASVSKASFDSLIPTIRAKNSFIVISANPDQESDMVWQMFGPEAPERDDSYVCLKDFRYNPFPLEPSLLHDITLMKRNRPADYDMIYLGKLQSSTDRPVVRSWNPELNIGVGKQSRTIYWSLDFNVNPQCSVICQWDGDHDFYFSDEIVLENASTYRVAEEFVKIYKKKYQGRQLVINGDASGRSRSSNSEYSNYAIIEQVLVKNRIMFDFQVPKSNGSISNRVNNFDWHVRGLDGKAHILVDPSCKHLCHACKLLSYDGKGNIIEVPARPGMKTIDYAKSHIFDAASYCVQANDMVLEDFVKIEKPKIVTMREMWEKAVGAPRSEGVEFQI